MADRNVKRTLDVVLGKTRPTLTIYPVLTGAPAAGAVLVPGAGAWGPAYTDIIGAGVIAVEFWLMQLMFSLSAGAHALREVQIYNLTTTTTVYECRVDVTAANTNCAPFKVPIPVYCSPGDRIQGRAGAAAAADKISVSVLVATGL